MGGWLPRGKHIRAGLHRVSDTPKETTYQLLHQVRHTEAQQGMIGINGFGLGLNRSEGVGVTGIAGAGLESSKCASCDDGRAGAARRCDAARGSELPIVGSVQ